MLDFETKDGWLWAPAALPQPPAPVPSPVTPADTLEPELTSLALLEPTPTVPQSLPVVLEPQEPKDTGADDEPHPNSEWERGRTFFDAGEYALALKCFEGIEAESPSSISLFNIAVCLERLHRLNEAEKLFRAAIDLDAEFSEARIALAWRLLGNQKTVEALAEFNQCLEEKRALSDAAFGRAVALERLGRQADALAAYSAINDSDPRYPDALGNIVSISAESGDVEKLRAASTDLLRVQPASINALAGLVTVELAESEAENQAENAAEHGRQLVRLAPESFEGWFNLGLALQKLNRGEEAAQAYMEAIKIAPDKIQPRANLAVILEQRGDVPGARLELERVLVMDPENPGALWNLALICEQDGHPESAENMYRELIRLGQYTAQASFRAGFLCLERGDTGSAIEAFTRAVKDQSDWTAAWFNLALAWLRAGNRSEALNALQHARTLDPESEQVQRMSAVFAIEDGDWELASQLETRLADRGAQTAEIAYNIGVLLQNAHRYEEATRYFERARQQNPDLLVPCAAAAGQ